MDFAAVSAILIQTPLPTPIPANANAASENPNGVLAWLPLWTALMAAAAAIGASALTQYLAARHEGERRTEQYRREDQHRRREELRIIYSDLIRNLDEYSLTMNRFEGYQDLLRKWEREANVDGMTKVVTVQTELTERILVTVSSINSLLGVVDLLGETAVHRAGTAYLVHLQHVKIEDQEWMAKGQGLNRAMKDAMRRSLAGELDPVM